MTVMLMLPTARDVRAAIVEAEPDLPGEAVDYLVAQWNAGRVVFPVPASSQLQMLRAPGVTEEEGAAIAAEYARLAHRSQSTSRSTTTTRESAP